MTNIKSIAGLTYAEAGVDIAKAASLVEEIKVFAQSTRTPGVLSGVGGFGAAFELPEGYQQPVLVSGTDGVGTKCLLANRVQQWGTIGIDLVAMCVNDILCVGAKPLYFLDYYATGCLNLSQSRSLIAGIAQGCRQAKMALIGGETAELPGMYAGSDYDLAGFCVGVVEKQRMLQASHVVAGDVIIAIASSGVHANGFSLVRRILGDIDIEATALSSGRLADTLLKPTKIYVEPILALLEAVDVHAIAHITGGGLEENIPRVIPPGLGVCLQSKSWQWPEVFSWLQQRGRVALKEMRSTFNLGVGMAVIVPKSQADPTIEFLAERGEAAWVLGEVRDDTSSAIQWE